MRREAEGSATGHRKGPGTVVQYAVESLRAEIVSAELRPGQQVIQEDLAGRLGISIAPIREALRVLEQEGQLTYVPRRGYFVTEFDLGDLGEIYDLRELLEARAARFALPRIDAEGLARIELAAAECAAAAREGDVTEELAANRRFHFEILAAADHPHLIRLIRLLWDSTEAYRAIYYNSPIERSAAGAAHDRIVAAIRAGDADGLVAELDAHRARALAVLGEVLDVGESGRSARSPISSAVDGPDAVATGGEVPRRGSRLDRGEQPGP